MNLPYRPQGLVQLRERIPEALERAYGVRDREKTWLCPKHVFDFESGLRLVVTRKVIDIGCDPMIHVTAMLSPHTMIWDHQRCLFKYRDQDPEEWIRRVVIGQFLELHPTPLEFLGFAGGVPHFFGDLRGMDRAEQGILAFKRRAV